MADVSKMSCNDDKVDCWVNTYVLNKGALVLEGVTLGRVVQLVVEVLVNLSGGTVLDQEAAENTLTAHPHDLPVIQHVSLDTIHSIDSNFLVARNSQLSRALATM